MRVLLLSLAAGALFACGHPGTTNGTGENGGLASVMAELPLQRGFYVMSDTACGDASHATLLLVRRAGMNGARDACDFESIEQTGPTSYRAVVTCRDIQGRGTEASTNLYEIPDAVQFSYGTDDSDYRTHFRYCEQSSLPDPWRDNDISDPVGGGNG